LLTWTVADRDLDSSRQMRMFSGRGWGGTTGGLSGPTLRLALLGLDLVARDAGLLCATGGPPAPRPGRRRAWRPGRRSRRRWCAPWPALTRLPKPAPGVAGVAGLDPLPVLSQRGGHGAVADHVGHDPRKVVAREPSWEVQDRRFGRTGALRRGDRVGDLNRHLCHRPPLSSRAEPMDRSSSRHHDGDVHERQSDEPRSMMPTTSGRVDPARGAA